MIAFLIKYWSQILSTISLLIAFAVAVKNRKHLNVEIDNALPPQTLDGDLLIFYPNSTTQSLGNGYVVSFTILNSSPNDIGYFDLTANAVSTNKRQYLLTYTALDINNLDPDYLATNGPSHKNLRIIRTTDHGKYILTIPEANYGMFKAYSFSRLDLFVVPVDDDFSDLIDVTFKVTSKSIFHTSKHAVVRNRKWFRAYSQTIDATNWSKLHTTNKEKQQQ